MNNHRVGSNQFQNKYGLSKDAMLSIWQVVAITAVSVLVITKLQPKIISPLSDSQHIVYAAEGKSELQEITDYVIKKFEPEGRQVAVKALACFISESGLRNEAVNVNHNGTNDVGVAQINSIHGLSTEDRMNYKKNIDKAYQIYKSRGWNAWYGAYCK